MLHDERRREARGARARTLLAASVLAALVPSMLACGGDGAKSKGDPPATATKKTSEAEMARLTLREEAVARLGLVEGVVSASASTSSRTVAGEIVPASGRSLVVAAPVAGTLSPSSPQGLRIGQSVRRGEALVRLTPVATVDRDVRAQSERALSAAETRLSAAEARATRTEKLVADGAASAQKLEEAREARDVAKAERDAAKERAAMLARSPLESDVGVVLRAPEDGVIRALGLGTSGMVASGAPLVEIVGTSALWVRASLFVGDLRKIRPEAPARVRPLTEAPGIGEVEALPLAGPPTADSTSASFDVYFALGKEASFRPGERVAVTLPYGARMPAAPSAPTSARRQVPASAVMRDAYGGAWVYAVVGKYTYERRRLEVSGAEAGLVTFESGPAPGTAIVTTGAAELFGFEITGK